MRYIFGFIDKWISIIIIGVVLILFSLYSKITENKKPVYLVRYGTIVRGNPNNNLRITSDNIKILPKSDVIIINFKLNDPNINLENNEYEADKFTLEIKDEAKNTILQSEYSYGYEKANLLNSGSTEFSIEFDFLGFEIKELCENSKGQKLYFTVLSDLRLKQKNRHIE